VAKAWLGGTSATGGGSLPVGGWVTRWAARGASVMRWAVRSTAWRTPQPARPSPRFLDQRAAGNRPPPLPHMLGRRRSTSAVSVLTTARTLRPPGSRIYTRRDTIGPPEACQSRAKHGGQIVRTER